MPAAYIIANVNVTNLEQYEAYKRLSTHAMNTYNAELLVRGGNAQTLEGDWSPTRIVILKFPSVEAARAYNDSPEYTAARNSRQGAADMQMIVVEGV